MFCGIFIIFRVKIGANVLQAGVSFLLVQVTHLSVNAQKNVLAWC